MTLYVKCKAGLPVEATSVMPDSTEQGLVNGWSSRWIWENFTTVERLAKYITAMTGKTYLPVDEGSGCFPRFDIIEAPAIGDKVSKGFNGDYTPEGEIVRITPTFRVVTSTGKTFIRRQNSSSWRLSTGTWGMVSGHINERNPSF